ncbi:MAG: acyl-CoA thioesterase [Magnetospirillum sp.]|nr:acyl-CoA thioesterase [Magnetospirillum sp.]
MFAHAVRVSWGDCDPAGILYTPRVFDYCTEALEVFYRTVLETDWITMTRRHNMGSPMVHASCDYLKPMPPDLELAVEVRLAKLGASSLTFALTGRAADGVEHFRARYIACITDFAAAKSIPIPEHMRRRAEDYMRLTSS